MSKKIVPRLQKKVVKEPEFLGYSKGDFQDLFEKYRVSFDQVRSNKIGAEHVLYYLPSKLLVELRESGDVKRWKNNRPPALNRVNAIRKYQDARGHVNGTLHLAYLEDQGIVVYEGNHRFQALTENVDGVVADMIWDASFTDVKSEFIAINSAMPVSTLYLDPKAEENDPIVNEIEDFVEDLCRTFPKMVSKNTRAIRPHFTADELKTRIKALHKHFSRQNHGGHALEAIFLAIMFLNKSFGDERREITCTKGKELKAPKMKKAEENKFYLYCPSDPLSITDMEWALQNYTEDIQEDY